MDANFSRILQKKREEQLEASKQRLFDSTTTKYELSVDEKETENKSESAGCVTMKKEADVELENSMMFSKVNKSWHDFSVGDDSFLALERQCNMEDKRERLLNANDTILFDVEPPSELWNQTINQSLTVANLGQTQDENETIEISPIKYIGLMRPSTIIEETSSQFDSSSKNSNTSITNKSSLYATASENESNKESSAKSCDIFNNSKSNSKSQVSPLSQQNPPANKVERQRRGTFAFKRANYTFFPNENLESIDESASSVRIDSPPNIIKTDTPKISKFDKLTPNPKQIDTLKSDFLDFETNSKDGCNEDEPDQFNNTLERVDYLLEKGRQMLEETPVAQQRSHHHHHSMLETPLFSCKRKRLLSEMASIEMQPLPKRGPLIDFSTPEVINQSRTSKFARK